MRNPPAAAGRGRTTSRDDDAGGSIPGRWYSVRLALVAQALIAVGAVSADVADEIAGRRRPCRRCTAPVLRPRPRPGTHPPGTQRTSWRVVPAGQVITIRDGDLRREVLVVACVQSAGGARFLVAEWPFGPFTCTAADDRGLSYRTAWAGKMAPRELRLCPDPPHEIRWLDLTTAAGEPAARIDLGPQNPPPVPDVTVTRHAHNPGELLLDVVAARILPPSRPSRSTTPQSRPPPMAACAPSSATGPVTSSPRCTRPACCRRTALSPGSSPGCAPGSVSTATASPRRPPGTCRTGGRAC